MGWVGERGGGGGSLGDSQTNSGNTENERWVRGCKASDNDTTWIHLNNWLHSSPSAKAEAISTLKMNWLSEARS